MWKNGTVNDDDEDEDDDDDGLLSIILIFASLTTVVVVVVVVGSSISVSVDCFGLFISSIVTVCVQTKVFNGPISSVLNIKAQKPLTVTIVFGDLRL